MANGDVVVVAMRCERIKNGWSGQSSPRVNRGLIDAAVPGYLAFSLKADEGIEASFFEEQTRVILRN